MRAAVLTDEHFTLEVVDVDDPIPQPGEVVLDVTACGICGSDFSLAHGLAAAGTVLGHEIAGRIAVPDADGRWKVGTDVAVRPFFGCGSCRQCERGRQDHCESFAMAGNRRPGAFAERVVASADELFAMPTEVTGADRALVEPLAIIRHAMRRVDMKPGDDVAILGAGPIGLAAVAWAHTMGARSIVVSEPDASRRSMAEQFGATAAVEPQALVSAVGASAPTVVLECSGRQGLINTALSVAGVEARVGVVGLCTTDDTFTPVLGLRNEIDLRFCMFYERVDFVDTLDAMSSHSLAYDGFVTDVIGFDDIVERFATAAANPTGGKIVFQP